MCIQELEKARAIIAARLASKDGSVADPASAANSSRVDAMSLIAHGYVSGSEEEEGEIEYSKAKRLEKRAKLQIAAAPVDDANNQYLPTGTSVSLAVDDSIPDTSASLSAEVQSTDNHSQHRTEKSESRSSDDHKSHHSKDSKRDRRDRDRHELSKSSKDRSREEASRKDRSKDNHRSSDKKGSKSHGDTDRHPTRKSHERETAKDVSQKSESEQHTSSKDVKVDGHMRHSSRSRETSRRHESDRTSESERRPSARRRSHSSPRQPSPDDRHRSSHPMDKKAER